MFILGISAFYHDSAAVLIENDKLLAAAQEERFSRIKNDASFPIEAVRFCLQYANIEITDVEAIVYYEKPLIKFERLLETYLYNAPGGFKSFRQSMPIWLKEKLFIKKTIRTQLAQLADCPTEQLATLYFDEHHRSHAASAYFPSPFNEAAVLCMDAVGEWATTSIWMGQGKSLKPVKELHFPHSLGLLYSAFTYYCGFKVNSGEYKLMGLAPYGEPRYVETIMNNLVSLSDDGSFTLDMNFFNYQRGLTMVSDQFIDLFAQPVRTPGSKIKPFYKDIARSIQDVTEKLCVNLAKQAKQITGSNNLCLAGGVALNCVANAAIKKSNLFTNLWVQPAAGDAGAALGAAYSFLYQYLGHDRVIEQSDALSGCYLGPAYKLKEITAVLDQYAACYQVLDTEQVCVKAAQLLADQHVIGWFQGRMEFGPRALGARSILADPSNEAMQTIINQKIKKRESFRPFAPAVIKEDARDYFQIDGPSPYMLLTAQVNPAPVDTCSENSTQALKNPSRQQLPAITHVDGSARVQTVDGEHHPVFYTLLQNFKSLTGCSVLLNTSFNVRGEPIVCTPLDAYRCFMKTDIDYIFIENVLLSKKEQPSLKQSL